MKRAIYTRSFLITVLGLMISGIISATIFAVSVENTTKNWLTKLTFSISENYKRNSDATYLSDIAGKNRITIVAPDGTVLADSEADPSKMENHASRDEIKNARQDKVYISIHKSATLGNKFMYAAIKMSDGNVLRVAESYPGFFHNLYLEFPAVLFAMGIALILALWIANRFSKTLMKPLEMVVESLSLEEYDKIIDYNSGYYEVDKLMKSTQNLLQKISDSKNKLSLEQKKIRYILSNMAEGFVMLDSEKNIVLCNQAAMAFFGCSNDPTSQNILTLTRDQEIGRMIDHVFSEGQSQSEDIFLNETSIINVFISPIHDVWADGDQHSEGSVTILLIDVTVERTIYRQKQDFFSNASHELKTPITSIIGFSEMLDQDMVMDENTRKNVYTHIKKEAKRLSELINDILTISRLESKMPEKEYTVFDFQDVIFEASQTIQPLAQSSDIEIVMNLDNVRVEADRRQLYEMAGNLIENAVKYNKHGGIVTISLTKNQSNAVFSVKDTGIGIPEASRMRVFERFHRVDSGRDKKAGGTGLGLSIVKHIVNHYHGKISLNSQKGVGTEMTITLPIVEKK